MPIRELNKKDFTVGQKAAIRREGNALRYQEKGDLDYYEATVEKIGNKYITVNGTQYSIGTGYEKSDYSPNGQLFESVEVLLQVKEKESIISELRSIFSSNYSRDFEKYTLEQLREVDKILNLNINNE